MNLGIRQNTILNVMKEGLEFNAQSVLQRAQGGDAEAVATLLQQSFSAKSTVKLQAFNRGKTLEIFLIDVESIEQSEAMSCLHDGLNKLRQHQIHWPHVTVESFIEGTAAPVWSKTWAWTADNGDEQIASPTLSDRTIHKPKSSSMTGASIGKIRRTSPRSSTFTKPTEKTSPKSHRLSNQAIGALLTGFLLAIPLLALGLFRTLFYGFVIMVHELGHAVTYWIFGYPAIPSVNLLFGGGITLAMGRIWLLVWLLLGGLGYLIYRYRQSSNALSWLLGVTVVYGLVSVSPWHTRLISYMGHGAENLAIVLCLYFAMGGYFCKLGGERAIYAMLGFFTWFIDLQFAWQITHNEARRLDYVGGIGGMIDNDFVKLANSLDISLDAIATFFLFTTLITPVIAFLLYRYEKHWQNALRGF